jgi:hypothetical protein
MYVYESVNIDFIESWEQIARDRVRFQNRIDSLGKLLEPVLKNKLTRINGSDILCS